MTPNDIIRMVTALKVPHSKTVECLYPNPTLTLHVPAAWIPAVTHVVEQAALPGQNPKVTMLESREVPVGQHWYVKVRDYKIGKDFIPVPDFIQNPTERRRYRTRQQLTINKSVVIDCYRSS